MKAIVELPDKLIPLFLGKADVRCAYGGRGSAKTMSFAKMTAVRGYQFGVAGRNGIILCCRQFQNSLEDSSFGAVADAIRSEEFLSDYYEIGDRFIRSKDGRIDYSFVGLERNINSVKSKNKILLAWADEAEPITDTAWQILIPTIREEGSELWVTWNPARKSSPVESRFRHSSDPLIKCVEINWRDNAKFPEKLQRERLRHMQTRPEDYEHVWEGAYITALKGAYFAKELSEAKSQNRIGRVAADPLLPIKLFADIGGTGAKSDAFAFWACQFVGKEIRVLNYYEAVGQTVQAHLEWLHSNGYRPERSCIYLPHDGATNDKVYDVSYESAFEKAGYDVEVIPNQGKGAAKQRIESSRRWFGSCWFNEATTQVGRDALGWYHEKWDDKRNTGLGPDHDWASHGADAFGLMAIVATESMERSDRVHEAVYLTTSWMG